MSSNGDKYIRFITTPKRAERLFFIFFLFSLHELLRYLTKKYGYVHIVGHNDLNATACLGKNLYSKLEILKNNLDVSKDEYVKVFMSNNKLSVVLDNGKKFSYSFTSKDELLKKIQIGLKIQCN